MTLKNTTSPKFLKDSVSGAIICVPETEVSTTSRDTRIHSLETKIDEIEKNILHIINLLEHVIKTQKY